MGAKLGVQVIWMDDVSIQIELSNGCHGSCVSSPRFSLPLLNNKLLIINSLKR